MPRVADPFALALAILLGSAGSVRLAQKGSKVKGALEDHPWPCKNANFERSGQGRVPIGPRSLSTATWIFETDMADKDDTFYQSPVIDRNLNTIFSSNNGRIYSMAPSGTLNWVTRLRKTVTGGQPPTPVLFGENLYTVDGFGNLLAIALASGKEAWRAKYAHSSGLDSWSMGLDVESGTLFAVGFPDASSTTQCQYGGTHLFALDIANGSEKWTYLLKDCNCNIMPSTAKGLVLVSDSTGNTYAIDVATGASRWMQPGNGHSTFTTGTGAMGENGMFYVTSNLRPGQGVLRAYSVETGEQRWNVTFSREANNAPAVFKDATGRLLVAVGISNNGGFPIPIPANFTGTIYGLDASSGRMAWAFEPPPWNHSSCAGSTWQKLCLPDAWSNPSVDARGTVYIGWQAGVIYAINGTTGQQVSNFTIASGTQGAPAIADGMLVASSCQRMVGFQQMM